MMKTLFKYLLHSISVLFLFACNQKPNNFSHQDSWDKSNIRPIDITDSSYLIAVKLAQDNIDLLIELFQDRRDNKFKFYVKSQFKENENVEHMWAVPDFYTNAMFTATIDNVPKNISNIKYKDKVKIAQEDIEDWIVYDGDSLLFGNFISNSIQE